MGSALRVGMGSSFLCSSREVCAVGRPQASAVYHVARYAAQHSGVPVIADVGAQTSSQVSMALTLGASTVMCGSLLAGTSESPGDSFIHDTMRMKLYRGIGAPELENSVESMKPQRLGFPGCAVVDRGPAATLLPQLLEDVKRDLRRLGCASVWQLHEDLYKPNIRFHVHTGR